MTWTLRAAVIAAAFVLAAVLVLNRYGGLAFWPALVTEFAATLLAVILALEIEARRERRALERAARHTNDVRSTEARKRLLAVRKELEKNQTSVNEIESGLLESAGTGGRHWTILNPQLLDGAWFVSGERLGDLLADYELVADLSIFYGRIEELRWRMRHRTHLRDPDLDGMIHALARELGQEVAGLLERVSAAERKPAVQSVGLAHFARVSGGFKSAGSVGSEVTRVAPESRSE